MSEAASLAAASNGSQRATQKSSYEEAADWPGRLKNATDRKTEYLAYLDSLLWRKKRIGALERAGGRCQVCNSKKRLDVHHRTYERIGNEAPEDLTVLCRKCHGLFHEEKRPMWKTKRRSKAEQKKVDAKVNAALLTVENRHKICSSCGKVRTTKGICRPCRRGKRGTGRNHGAGWAKPVARIPKGATRINRASVEQRVLSKRCPACGAIEGTHCTGLLRGQTHTARIEAVA